MTDAFAVSGNRGGRGIKAPLSFTTLTAILVAGLGLLAMSAAIFRW
jgi:hypothetical protein